MKTSLLTLFCFVLSFGFYKTAYASHFPGSEISYQCTPTPGIFEVTLVMYRECDGGSLAICPGGCGSACNQTIQITGADPGFMGTVFGIFSLQLQNVRDVDVKPTCPSIKNTCTNRGCVTAGTYTPSVERYEFKGMVNLGPTSGIPSACCNIRLPISICCRSSDIQTGAAGANYYNEAVINRCLSISPCNGSPVFKTDPNIEISGGQNYVANWAAIDPDHDSLSYSFAPALISMGASVLYTSPFAYDKPMPWTGNAAGLYPQGIRCDPLNGDIMFTPPNSGTYFKGVICIAVKQWKNVNGVPTVIGTTRRDIEMTIGGAYPPNNPPRLITNPPEDGNVNVPNMNLSVCEGEQNCFTVTAKDTDFNPPTVSDTTFLSWDSALASLGATFLPDYDAAKRTLPDSLGGGPREDRYKFCWTPPAGSASSTPYYFRVNAADKRCPNPGKLTRSFSILVLQKAFAHIQTSPGGCNQHLLSYTNTNPAIPISSAIWHIAKTANDSLFANGFNSYPASTAPTPFVFQQQGRIFIRLEVISSGANGSAGCSNMFSTYIDATPVFVKDSVVTTDILCSGKATGKMEVYGFNGTAPYQYKLNNQGYTNNGVFTNLIAGKHLVYIKDSNNCVVTDTVELKQPFPIQKAIASTTPFCHNDSTGSIVILATGGVAPYLYSINQQTPQTGSSFYNIPPGKHAVKVIDANTCMTTDSVVLSNPPAIMSQHTITSITCFGDNDGRISVTPLTGKTPFKYKLNQQPFQSSPNFEHLAVGTYLITTSDSMHCIHQDSVVITQPTILSYVKTKTDISCYNANDGSLSIVASGGTAPYALLFDSVAYPLPGTINAIPYGIYPYQLVDDHGCTVVLADTFINPPKVIAGTISGDATVAAGSTHTYSVPFQPTLTFMWNVTGGTLLSSSPNPPSATIRWDSSGTGKITMVVSNTKACNDTSQLMITITGASGVKELSQSMGITVYPNPAKNILNIHLKQLPEDQTVKLYDMQGKLVLEQDLKLHQQLNIETLTPGVYMLKIGAWSGQMVKE